MHYNSIKLLIYSQLIIYEFIIHKHGGLCLKDITKKFTLLIYTLFSYIYIYIDSVIYIKKKP